MWLDLNAVTKRFAGASGTVTVPKGCSIIHVAAHSSAAATVTLPDGIGGEVTVPIPTTGFFFSPQHLLCVVQDADYDIVFTDTDGYFVEIYGSRGLF